MNRAKPAHSRRAWAAVVCASALAAGGIFAWEEMGQTGSINRTPPNEKPQADAPAPADDQRAPVAEAGGAEIQADAGAVATKRQLDEAIQTLLTAAQNGGIPLAPGDPGEEPLDLHDPASAGLIIRRWARCDLNAAKAWCQSLPESDKKSEVMRQVALMALAADPKAAEQWAQGLPGGASRDAVIETLGWETAAGDPEGSLSLAAGLPDGDERTRLVQHSAAEWAQSDPTTAIAWAKQIEEPGLREQTLEAIATAWSGSDPRAAAGLIASDIEPGAVQTRAAAEVIQRWAQQDPQGAAGWVGSFPPGAVAESATVNLVAQWAQSDREACWNWLCTVRDPGMSAAGFTALARSSALTDADFAARCYSQAGNQPTRF